DSCSECVAQTVTETDRSVTETNLSMSEANHSRTEADRVLSEADQNIQTLIYCGIVGEFMHRWGGNAGDVARALVQTADGGYAVAGQTASTGLTAGNNDEALVRYDASGVEQWYNT